MESGSWEKVKELYEAALKYSSDERVRFLEKECNGDDELRREVESLLNYSDGATSFLEQPAVGTVAEDIVASQNAGIREGNDFGHYRIIKKLGAGGMGEVYLAKDTILNRHVALKILLPEIAKDDDRVRRFKLEARAASALNHPNIVTIYEIGEAEDKLFIAYEYVDGQTLREKIVGNQLTVFGALKIAKQIADALAVTHEAGVVHRDIKPENIMVRRDGYVKILDFGLAKRRIFNSDSEDETLEQIKTQRGIILGSIQYMSPEQARGEETDERTDIWSLGVCLYEMLTGKNPFAGKTISDSIAAILHLEPEPLRKIIGGISEELEKIINKTLRKNLFERYQSINEFLVDLMLVDLQNNEFPSFQETLELPQSASVENEYKTTRKKAAQDTRFSDKITDEQSKTKTQETAVPNPKEGRITPYNYKIWIIVFLPVLLLILDIFRSEIVNYFKSPKPDRHFESIQLSQLTDDGNATPDCAISPDGKFVAYVKRVETDKESLIVRQILTGSTVEIIPPSSLTIHSLTFSPNGEFIYYFISKKIPELIKGKKVIYKVPEMHFLYKVPTLGGRSEALFEDQFISSRIIFSPDGDKMVFIKDFGAETSVFITNSNGSVQREVLKNKQIGVGRINEAIWLPDGKGLLLGLTKEENIINNKPAFTTQIATFDLERKSIGILSERAWNSAHSFRLLGDNSGVVFLGNLFQGNQEKKGILQIWSLLFSGGPPKQITTDSNGFSSLDISKDGKTMLVTKSDAISSLWSFDPVTKGFKQIKSESNIPFADAPISFTPDGKVLFSKMIGTKAKIFSMNEDGSNEKQITFGDIGDDYSPVATPDGKYIIFVSTRSGRICLWRIDSDGTNPLQLTRVEQGVDDKIQIMPDGKSVLFSRVGGEDQGVRKVSIDGSENQLLISAKDSAYYRNPKISPNGKYLAFLNNEYDREKFQPKYLLKIVDFGAEREGIVLASKELNAINDTFQWSPDSKYLTYIKDGTPNLWSFPIKGGNETQLTDFSLGNLRNYAWSADRKRILIIRGIVNFDLVLVKDETK